MRCVCVCVCVCVYVCVCVRVCVCVCVRLGVRLSRNFHALSLSLSFTMLTHTHTHTHTHTLPQRPAYKSNPARQYRGKHVFFTHTQLLCFPPRLYDKTIVMTNGSSFTTQTTAAVRCKPPYPLHTHAVPTRHTLRHNCIPTFSHSHSHHTHTHTHTHFRRARPSSCSRTCTTRRRGSPRSRSSATSLPRCGPAVVLAAASPTPPLVLRWPPALTPFFFFF